MPRGSSTAAKHEQRILALEANSDPAGGGGGGGVTNVIGVAPIVVTTPSPGVKQVASNPATATQPGHVTIAAQTFAGNKTFNNGATLATTTALSQQQGGTLLSPTTEVPLLFLPRDPTYGSFSSQIQAAFFPPSLTADYVWDFAVYNSGGALPVPQIRATFETDYDDGTNHNIEMHFGQYTIPAGWHGAPLAFSGRPFSAAAAPNGLANAIVGFHSSVAGTGYVQIYDSEDNTVVFQIDRNRARFFTAVGASAPQAVTIATGDPNPIAGIGFCTPASVVKATVGYWDSLGAGPGSGAAVFGGADGTPLYIGRINSAGDGRQELLSIDASYHGIQLFSYGNGIPVTTSFGSGVGVLGITNATTLPTTDPTGGGVQYANAGANVWRGSAGTTTAMAPA